MIAGIDLGATGEPHLVHRGPCSTELAERASP